MLQSTEDHATVEMNYICIQGRVKPLHISQVNKVHNFCNHEYKNTTEGLMQVATWYDRTPAPKFTKFWK